MPEPTDLSIAREDAPYMERSINNAIRIIADADATAAIVFALDKDANIFTVQYIQTEDETEKEKLRALFYEAIKAFDAHYLSTYGEQVQSQENTV